MTGVRRGRRRDKTRERGEETNVRSARGRFFSTVETPRSLVSSPLPPPWTPVRPRKLKSSGTTASRRSAYKTHFNQLRARSIPTTSFPASLIFPPQRAREERRGREDERRWERGCNSKSAHRSPPPPPGAFVGHIFSSPSLL